MGKSSTSFKFGNNAWQARSSHGRNPIFETPEILEKACYEYFQWVQDNPLIAAETVKFQGVGKTMAVPRMRAMTILGLVNFLDIDESTWYDYRKKPDFSKTVKKIDGIIMQQKIEGAAADMLNPSFIGKEIGLVEKNDVSHSGSISTTYTDDLEANAIAATQAKSSESEK